MLRPWILVLAAPLLAGACNDQPPLLAPDTARLEGVDLHLSVGLWRDFMCCASDGSLDAAIMLTAPDSLPVPGSVSADSVWVVNGQDTWAAALSELGRDPGYANFGAWGGPKWAVGARVDVYVTLRDGAHRRLLEAARQEIRGSF